MTDVFLKVYWGEEDILFYYHFQDNIAVRQIEISSEGTKYLSASDPIQGDSMLADQPLPEAEYKDENVITKEEFERVWNVRE